jgi:hypothetical protein
MPVQRRKLTTSAVTPIKNEIPTESRLLKIPQAAKYLNRSIWRIRQMLSTGELRTVGSEKPFVIDRFDLDAYIEKAKAA